MTPADGQPRSPSRWSSNAVCSAKAVSSRSSPSFSPSSAREVLSVLAPWKTSQVNAVIPRPASSSAQARTCSPMPVIIGRSSIPRSEPPAGRARYAERSPTRTVDVSMLMSA
jgi:hypothetical protein